MADKKVIAINIIHRTLAPGIAGDKSKGVKATPPKIQVVKPGTAFLASTDKGENGEESEFDFLTKSTPPAAREPKSDEKVEITDDGTGEVVKPSNPARKVGSGADSDGGEGGELPDFDKLKKADLVKYAKENNIAIDDKKSEAEIRETIKGATGSGLV